MITLKPQRWKNRKQAKQSSSHVRTAANAEKESSFVRHQTPPPPFQIFAVPSARNALPARPLCTSPHLHLLELGFWGVFQHQQPISDSPESVCTVMPRVRVRPRRLRAQSQKTAPTSEASHLGVPRLPTFLPRQLIFENLLE